MAEELLVHATCVALGRQASEPGTEDKETEAAILLFGPSGAGKSDLALRLIDQGATLVSDDQTRLSRQGERLWASPPKSIAGRMEVRGLGIVSLPFIESAPLSLCVNLTGSENIERLPKPETRRFLGISLPSLDLFPFEVSAPAKLRLAVRDTSRFIMDRD